MNNLLEIRGLQIRTPRGKDVIKLVDKVDLDVGKKQSFGIVGESGCGKLICDIERKRIADQSNQPGKPQRKRKKRPPPNLPTPVQCPTRPKAHGKAAPKR